MVRHSHEEEERKRAIFDGMSQRQRERIMAKGYENWDPFELPQEPIDLRVDRSKHTASGLTREFLKGRSPNGYSNDAYSQGVWEICNGILDGKDRYIGMYEFSCWYCDFLRKEGIE